MYKTSLILVFALPCKTYFLDIHLPLNDVFYTEKVYLKKNLQDQKSISKFDQLVKPFDLTRKSIYLVK